MVHAKMDPKFQTGKQPVQEGGGRVSRKEKLYFYFLFFVFLGQMYCRTLKKNMSYFSVCMCTAGKKNLDRVF